MWAGVLSPSHRALPPLQEGPGRVKGASPVSPCSSVLPSMLIATANTHATDVIWSWGCILGPPPSSSAAWEGTAVPILVHESGGTCCVQLSICSCLPVVLWTGVCSVLRFALWIALSCSVLFSRQSLTCYIALTGLEFTRMTLNLQQSSCLCFSNTGTTCVKPTLWTPPIYLFVCLFVAQVGLELTETHLPPPPEY